MVVIGLMVAFLSVCFSIASPSLTRARDSASTTCVATPRPSAMPGLTPSDGPGSVPVQFLLYVHRDRADYLGRGAQDAHLDFHAAPEI